MPENNRLSFNAIKQGAFAFLYQSPAKMEEYRWDMELCSASSSVGLDESENLGPPWLISKPVGIEESVRQYAPFKEKGLLRRFVRLSPTPERIRQFAHRYGYLGHPVQLYYPDHVGEFLWPGESLQFWQKEIEEISALVKLWDLIRNEQAGALTKYIHWRTRPRGVWLEWPSGRKDLIASEVVSEGRELLQHWKDGDLFKPARYFLCDQINERLRGHVSPSILPFRDGEIYMFPDCLRSALYVLFMLEVSWRTYAAIPCAGCGEYFVPEHRSDQKHCSKACRNRKYYRKKIKGKGVQEKD